jgi:two-component system, OmpR family, alkaline phosphatase synthesis response regulator PhoP
VERSDTMTKRVLIVDDERNIVTALEFLMELNGYEVKTARDGEEALIYVVAFKPELILLDVMLPLRSGFEVLQKIRETIASHDIKIILLTAKGRDVEINKGLALGADAYLTKPFSTKELLVEVRRLLGDER